MKRDRGDKSRLLMLSGDLDLDRLRWICPGSLGCGAVAAVYVAGGDDSGEVAGATEVADAIAGAFIQSLGATLAP